MRMRVCVYMAFYLAHPHLPSHPRTRLTIRTRTYTHTYTCMGGLLRTIVGLPTLIATTTTIAPSAAAATAMLRSAYTPAVAKWGW